MSNTIERVKALQATQAAEREEQRLVKEAQRKAETEAFAPLKKMADDVRELPLAGQWKSYAKRRDTNVGDKFSYPAGPVSSLGTYDILGNTGETFSANFDPATGKAEIRHSRGNDPYEVVTMEEAQERFIKLVARMTSEVWP